MLLTAIACENNDNKTTNQPDPITFASVAPFRPASLAFGHRGDEHSCPSIENHRV
jgi:hypothetical protein